MRAVRRGPTPGPGRPLGGGRAAVLGALTVLLPLLGQAGGASPWGSVLACCGSAAFLGLLLCVRDVRSPERVLAALGGAQAAFHLTFTLPGLYPAAPGHPSWEVPAGHAVTVVLAVRLLGVTDAVLRPLRTLATAARQRLSLRLPGPVRAVRRLPSVPLVAPGRTTVAFRAPPCRGERAPPYRRVIPRVPLPLRPVPGGGAHLV
ncbi:hypothetical protein ACH4TX_34530 [Streptomyces sp. NPDC021098]|uniref:hypothetical protein n=1 Tax=unclassified Streptomyces TaxID=2593676 RepID=UPI0037A34FD5